MWDLLADVAADMASTWHHVALTWNTLDKLQAESNPRHPEPRLKGVTRYKRCVFKHTSNTRIDVIVNDNEEELIPRDGDEKLIFNADNTLKYPHKHGNNTTSPSDSFPSLTSSETSDSSLEEFANEPALLDLFPPRNDDDNFDPEADLREIEYLLNRDPSIDSSPKTNIDIIDPILKRFTNEPALIYSFPPGDDDDDLFYFKSDNKEWKKLLYGDLFDNTHSENEKDKDLKMECLIDDMDDDFFPSFTHK
uniref:Reverse transcriptase domain-containing protein n=1 Tax=Tanacetum cinerariifolium TaxID=118510 RepID=A0A6L2JVF5_TANCI|nr:hypothetical protein [Tanacetum cinerariifolium]